MWVDFVVNGMVSKERVVEAGFAAVAGFVGGFVNEGLMRMLYLQRLRMEGVTWDETPPPTPFHVWIGLMENSLGVAAGAVLTFLGTVLPGMAGRFLTLAGAGALGYTGGKMCRDVFLPGIVEHRT